MFPFSFGQPNCPTGRGGPTQFGLTQAVTISKPGKIRKQTRGEAKHARTQRGGAMAQDLVPRATPAQETPLRMACYDRPLPVGGRLEEEALRRLLVGQRPSRHRCISIHSARSTLKRTAACRGNRAPRFSSAGRERLGGPGSPSAFAVARESARSLPAIREGKKLRRQPFGMIGTSVFHFLA